MSDVLPTLKDNTIMLKMLYRKEKSVTYYLAWDVVKDIELESFESEDLNNLIMLGAKGNFGYIVNSRNEVISLDRSITFTMFNIWMRGNFPVFEVTYLMNSTEEYFVFDKTIYLRYSLAQILYAQGLRDREERP